MEHDTRNVVMVRFGEIFLKSEPVRREFINRLRDNIRASLNDPDDHVTITITRSRILVSSQSPRDLISPLSKIFGIVDIAPVSICESTINGLCSTALRVAQGRLMPHMRFAVRARREGVDGFTSQELAARIGSSIMNCIPDLKVDLTCPEYEIFVEARKEGGLVYDIRIPGPGGLPYGTQGKALALISAGIDSPVAAWLMMRRGVRLVLLHLDPGRFGGVDIGRNLTRNIAQLSHWIPGLDLVALIIPAEPMYATLMHVSEPKYRCVLCKRVMLELAMLCAQENGCEGIITGDNLGQVATQTLHNLATLSAGVDIPIYRPLIGYDKEEIITLARKIGTFALDSGDTSCAVLPSRPVTKSEVGRINTLMDELDLRSVFGDLLRSSRKIMVRNGIVKEG